MGCMRFLLLNMYNSSYPYLKDGLCMSDVSQLRKEVIMLVLDMPEELLPAILDYIVRLVEQDIAEGRIIPFDQVIKELL